MENEENKETVLASTDTGNNEVVEETNVSELKPTIKATTLQDNLEGSNKRDLSAIIPDKAIQGEKVDETLRSKSDLLNSDGSIVIGNIENDSLVMANGAKFPDKIDIEARKKIKQEALKEKKNVGSKKIKKNLTDEAKKAQNITSLIVIVVLLLLGAFGYYYFNQNTEKDFKTKNIEVELGTSLPVRTLDYVKPANVFKVGIFDFSWLNKNKSGAKVTVNDLEYSISTSNVKIDEVGEYSYTVTHAGVTKTGTINIIDTTAPKLELKEVRIMEGATYTPQSFITSCVDLSGCRYEYESKDMENITKPGTYRNGIKIVALDPYDNKTVVTTTLVIETKGDVRNYKKVIDYNPENGYSLTSSYELHLSYAAQDVQMLLYANYVEEYVYKDVDKYNEDHKKLTGEKNYSFDDKNMTIKKQEELKSIDGASGSSIDVIHSYLVNNGYILQE